jgi:geranyl-CoA carboxylase alpha subunit
MVAKVISHGATRDEARRRLIEALGETVVFGVTTNKQFLVEALKSDDFKAGAVTTGFIAKNFRSTTLAPEPLLQQNAAIAAVLLFINARDCANALSTSNVSQLLNWTSASSIPVPFQFGVGDDQINAAVTPTGSNRYCVNIDGDDLDVLVESIRDRDSILQVNGERIKTVFNFPNSRPGKTVQFSTRSGDFEILNQHSITASSLERTGAGLVKAPMHGVLIDIFVSKGQAVKKGDRLAILEAMKMQHEMVAEIDGAVSEIFAASGTQVAANSMLMQITAADC